MGTQGSGATVVGEGGEVRQNDRHGRCCARQDLLETLQEQEGKPTQ